MSETRKPEAKVRILVADPSGEHDAESEFDAYVATDLDDAKAVLAKELRPNGTVDYFGWVFQAEIVIDRQVVATWRHDEGWDDEGGED